MGLTVKQEAFCQLAAFGSYADAYRAVYEPSPGYSYRQDINQLTKRPDISRRILEIQLEAPNPVKDAMAFLINFHFLRMTYDAAEISRWVKGACRHCYGDGGGYQWRLHEYLEAMRQAELASGPLPDIAGGFGYNGTREANPTCENCDGKGKGSSDFADTADLSASARAAFEGIKQTKDGIEIRMADKQKAAESYGKLCGLDVVQIRNLVEPIPDAAELARLEADPEAGLRLYAALVNGASGRTVN